MKKIIIVFPLFLFFFYCFSFYSFAKDFYNLSGDKMSYSGMISNPKTVLFLWATWCSHCSAEVARLNKKCGQKSDINFFYIDLGEKKSTVKEKADRMNLTPCIRKSIFLDVQGDIARKFSVIGIPTYIFLKNGVLLYRSHYLTDDMLNKIYPK